MEGHFPFILTACGAAISLVLGIWSSLRNGVKPMTLSGTVVCTFLFLILIYGQNNNDQLANLVARSFIFYFVFTFVLFVLAFHPYYFLKGFFFTSYLNGIPIAVHQLVQFIAVMSVSLNRIYQLQSLIPPLQVFVVLLFVYIYPLGTIEAFSTIDFMTRKQIKLECGKNEEKISYQISLVVFLVVLAVMLLFPFNWLMYNIAVLAYAVLLLKYCFFHHTILCLSLVTLISLIDAVVFPVHEVGIAPVGLITCPEILFTTDCVTAFRMEYLFVPGLLISCICHYEKYRVPDRLKILPSENSEIRVGIPENEEELVQERQKIILIAASIGYILSSFAAHYFSFLSKYTLLTLTLGTSLLPLIVLMLLYWPKGELLRFIATHSHQEIIDQLSYAFQKTKDFHQPIHSKGQSVKINTEIETESTELSSLEFSSSSTTPTTSSIDYNSHLLKSFRLLMADFSNVLAHDPIIYQVLDRLFSNFLISTPVKNDISTTLGVPLDRKASKLVDELYRQLNSHSEPVEYLTKLCDALDPIEDPALQCVVNKIKMSLSN